jgi:hypothetical protein
MCLIDYIINVGHKIGKAEWSTIWTAAQAILVPLAVGAPIVFGIIQENNKHLKDIETYANLNFYVVRYLRPMSKKYFSSDKELLIAKTTLSSCLRMTQAITLERIYPSRLSEQFADIDVQATRALSYLSLPSPEQYSGEIEECARLAERSLKAIDDFLRSKNVRPDRSTAPWLEGHSAAPV